MENMVFAAGVNSMRIEPVENISVDVPKEHFTDYDENVGVKCNMSSKLEHTDSIKNNFSDIYSNEKPNSESESDDLYDECYSCFMCNVSYNTLIDLNEHFSTHSDDDTFHHSNINSISEPLPRSSIRPSKFFRCSECKKICKSQLSYHEHMLTHTGEKPHHCGVRKKEKSERDVVHEAIESSRQDIQNMLQKRKEQLTNYNTEEYQKLIEDFVHKKNSDSDFDVSKLIGPLFWKNALVKAGLIEEYVRPMQFQSRLKFTECISCKKCFARLPESTENKVLPSKPPCSGCFKIKNESALNQHKSEAHSETPPFICKECFLELNSWYKYVQHMKMHLKYAAKCNECIYHMHHKSSNVIFLCHVCNLSFESDDQLTIHINTHLENGQNEGSLD